MSDDDGDFFDTPRGNDSPKKYSWSSGAPRSSSGSTHQPKVVNVNKHGVHSNSDSETAYNSTDKQIIVTNIPTGKSQNSSGSETETSEDEQNSNIKPRRSSEKDQHKSRRYSSGSSSSSTTSGSDSRSRSSSVSENERKSLNNGKQPRNSESFTKAKDYGGEVSNRPKTSVRRKVVHTNDWKTSNTKKDYSDDDSSASSSDSESDMTDVSPLTSPHQPTPKHSPKKVKILENADSISPMHKDLYSYKVRPKSAHAGGYEHLLRGDKDSVNLKVLMEAILEMERDKEQEHSESNSHKRYRASRSNRNPSSISGTVSSNVSCSSKTNLSFSNSRAREIDRENQRLMKEILKHSRTKKKASTQKKLSKPMPATNVITSATVNRIREQERIDRENKSMLKRLEDTTATKMLRRDVLDKELYTTTYVGVPLGVIHAQKGNKSRPRSAKSPYGQRSMSAGSRSRSMSQLGSDTCSVLSDATAQSGFSSSTVRSRRSNTSAGSAHSKQRPKSAHVMNSSSHRPHPRRPAWEDGW